VVDHRHVLVQLVHEVDEVLYGEATVRGGVDGGHRALRVAVDLLRQLGDGELVESWGRPGGVLRVRVKIMGLIIIRTG
jgi:hypothetical protein